MFNQFSSSLPPLPPTFKRCFQFLSPKQCHALYIYVCGLRTFSVDMTVLSAKSHVFDASMTYAEILDRARA